MNKAITDGLILMPTPFSAGLGVWSSGDGTPGSDTYAGAGGGVFVPADQDFAGCLEIVKTAATQKIRYMGETPILPGCYLRVTARVKAVAGALPSVRIAGWPGTTGGAFVPGRTMTGPAKALTAYGEVVEVSAIIGTSGSASRSFASWRYSGRKSWPHSDTQCASSIAMQVTFHCFRFSTQPSSMSRSGAT